MKIDDDLLEALGNAYRWVCGVNDVLISEGRIITFERFIREFFASRNLSHDS